MGSLRVKQWNMVELELFCRRLSTLLTAGIHAQEAVSLLKEEASLPFDALEQVERALGEGKMLSQALREAECFGEDMVAMVVIGERSGHTEEVLANLAKFYARQEETRWALRRAVGYPALMAGVIVAVFALVVTQVLPIFSRVFAQAGLSLPPMVAGFVAFGEAGRLIIYAVAIALVGAALFLFWRTERSNQPPIGKTARLALDRSRFANAFALLLASGVPIDESLIMSEDFLKGSPLCEQIERAKLAYQNGDALAKALGDSEVLTRADSSQLSVGMRSGNSDEMMQEVSERCADTADKKLNTMLSRFEFILVLALCLLVGLILMMVILPLLGVLTAIV